MSAAYIMPIIARLEARTRVEESGCWTWIGGTSNGYGKIAWRGRSWHAHRLVYVLLRGPVPKGLVIDHLCRNRACVNPDHLEPVTTRENLLRGETHAARNAAKTGCGRGHGPFDYVTPDGKRQCRRCAAERQRRYRRRASS